REDISLARAAREEHVSPETVQKYLPAALRRSKSGQWFATKSDKYVRLLWLPSPHGFVPVRARGSEEANLVGRDFFKHNEQIAVLENNFAEFVNVLCGHTRNVGDGKAFFILIVIKKISQPFQVVLDPVRNSRFGVLISHIVSNNARQAS